MIRNGEIPDFNDYQSPIQVICDDIKMKYENGVCEAVHNAGFYVDKEELKKALAYDRQQYSEGYLKGYYAGIEQGKADALKKIKEYINKGV